MESELKARECERMTAEMSVRLSQQVEQLQEALAEMQKQAEAKNKK